MCLHDHDATPSLPPAALSRRNVIAGAAVLAGVTAGGIASASSASALGEVATSGRAGSVRSTTATPLVVEGGSVVDPLTGHVIEDGIVVLREGRVLAVGSRDTTRRAVASVGSTARRIDASGRWVVPGLIDVHVHANALADARALVRAGATSVRSGSSSFYQDVAMRSLPDRVPGLAPRMRAAGIFVSPQLGDSLLADPELAPLAALPGGVTSTADIAHVTRVNVSRGVDVVKTRANPRAGLAEQDPRELVYDREQLTAVVRAASGRPVLCHAYSAEGYARAPQGPTYREPTTCPTEEHAKSSIEAPGETAAASRHHVLTDREAARAPSQSPSAHFELTWVDLTIATIPNGTKQKRVHTIAQPRRVGGGGAWPRRGPTHSAMGVAAYGSGSTRPAGGGSGTGGGITGALGGVEVAVAPGDSRSGSHCDQVSWVGSGRRSSMVRVLLARRVGPCETRQERQRSMEKTRAGVNRTNPPSQMMVGSPSALSCLPARSHSSIPPSTLATS